MTSGLILLFFLAFLLKYVFAVRLGWLPPSGRQTPGIDATRVTGLFVLDGVITREWDASWDSIKHLILPWIALGTIPFAVIFRITRASVLEVQGEDFVRTAEAKGLTSTTIRFPVWFDPVAEGGTPMQEALKLAAAVVGPWVAAHQESYPPIVINITDGEPTTGDPTKAARALTSLHSADGDVLLYNVHLSALAAAPVSFPASSAKLPDRYAGLLFSMSSEVPHQIREELSVEGYPAEPGTRGFTFNADAWALLQFLDIGTRVTLGA